MASEERQVPILLLDPVKDFSIIKNYNVTIPDISDAVYGRLGAHLEVTRLSTAEARGSFPVHGVVYGDWSRMFVPFVVEKRGVPLWVEQPGTKVHVLFLYDSASPGTFLRRDTLQALGVVESHPAETQVFIQGLPVIVEPSRNGFENVDLLGQDFLENSDALLTVDFQRGLVIITVM